MHCTLSPQWERIISKQIQKEGVAEKKRKEKEKKLDSTKVCKGNKLKKLS
jgi:hypothetical protein